MSNDRENLETKFGLNERKLSDGKYALLVEDKDNLVEGIIYHNKKLVDSNNLARIADEKQEIIKELEFNEELLSMHRHFDGLRDAIKKKQKTIDQVVQDALSYLGTGVDGFYVGFHLNPELKKQGKINQKYAGYECTEVFRGKSKYEPLNEAGERFFKTFREENPEFNIDFNSHKDESFKEIEKKAKQISDKKHISGDGFTLYLQPGNDIIGAVQAIQTKKINFQEKQLVKEWVLLADTFLSDVLEIKIEGDSGTSEEQRLESMFGMSIDEMGKGFTGGGDYRDIGKNKKARATEEKKKAWLFYKPQSFFDKEYNSIRDGVSAFFAGFRNLQVEETGSTEEITRRKFEKGSRIIKEIYRERPEFGVDREESEKDLNSAISGMKILQGLYIKYGEAISKDYKLSDRTDVDKETLENASMFAIAFARAVKYMHQADNLPRIEEIRSKNDMREMTNYLASLIETPELTGEFIYNGEPLVNRLGKPSKLGSTIIDISTKIDPNKESHFAVDLVEKVMSYEELVQDTSKSPGMEIDDALLKMYWECIKTKPNKKVEIDRKGLNAIKMIDNLVHPEKTGTAYDLFIKEYERKVK